MKTIIFTFGRMNPPTIGHEVVISKVLEESRKNSADHVIFLSQSHKAPNNPLSWDFRVRVCEAAFKGVNISKDKNIKNPFLALEYLAEHYDRIIMVAGSDQLDEYRTNFAPYARDWGVKFKVISSGNRLDESENMIEMISASKLRQYALENNKKKFFEGMPSTLKPAIMELVYKNVQKGMKKPR